MTPKPNQDSKILAAGGVITRRHRGHSEFLIVHRPRHDDWSLPKGKLENSEKFSEASIREVKEETGSEVKKLAKIGSIAYKSTGGRAKVVRYWLFEYLSGKFQPNYEVDEIRWVEATDAMQILTYPRDRNVFAWGATLTESPSASRIQLVRHAKTGIRAEWRKSNQTRTLTKPGHEQATLLSAYLTRNPVDRIESSTYIRCIQTLEPFAAAITKKVLEEPSLTEGAATRDLIDRIAKLEGKSVAMCSHGKEIEALLQTVRNSGALITSRGIHTEQGGAWDIKLDKGQITSARYLPPPS